MTYSGTNAVKMWKKHLSVLTIVWYHIPEQ